MKNTPHNHITPSATYKASAEKADDPFSYQFLIGEQAENSDQAMKCRCDEVS